MGIIWEPKECKVCENCFCNQCLQRWLSTGRNGNQRCPLKCSDEPKFRDKPHKIIRNMLSELIFRCKNHQSGCLQEIDYSRIIEHEKSCQFTLMQCSGMSDGCTTILIKSELPQHELTCPMVPVQCEYCHKQVKRSGIRAHWMACEEAELECEMCHGVFKKKNYPIHVNALCEENIMSCGRCSGTYKRKYKEYHDCVRHLQNCQKTLNEEIMVMKGQLTEKDRRISELESRVFFEMAEMRRMVENLGQFKEKQEEIKEIGNNQIKQISPSKESSQVQHKWNFIESKLFKPINISDQTQTQFDLKQVERKFKPQDMIFGYSFSNNSLAPSSYLQIDLDITLNSISTSFIPMYFLVGTIDLQDISKLPSLDTASFDSLYSTFSSTCSFLPFIGKSFTEKLKFSIRQQILNETQSKLEIEELSKQQSLHKIEKVKSSVQRYAFFGVYCSQATHLSNHKDIKVKFNF